MAGARQAGTRKGVLGKEEMIFRVWLLQHREKASIVGVQDYPQGCHASSHSPRNNARTRSSEVLGIWMGIEGLPRVR
jgi:hypothetical protein